MLYVHWGLWRYWRYLFFCTGAPPPEIYTLSLHDALPILQVFEDVEPRVEADEVRHFEGAHGVVEAERSEEHTSELQSRPHLVCRLLLEKKKDKPGDVEPLGAEPEGGGGVAPATPRGDVPL